jgi:hypothetical protein
MKFKKKDTDAWILDTGPLFKQTQLSQIMFVACDRSSYFLSNKRRLKRLGIFEKPQFKAKVF